MKCLSTDASSSSLCADDLSYHLPALAASPTLHPLLGCLIKRYITRVLTRDASQRDRDEALRAVLYCVLGSGHGRQGQDRMSGSVAAVSSLLSQRTTDDAKKLGVDMFESNVAAFLTRTRQLSEARLVHSQRRFNNAYPYGER